MPWLPLVLIAATYRDGQTELAWVAGYMPRWITCLLTITNLSTICVGMASVEFMIKTDVLTSTLSRQQLRCYKISQT